MNKLSEKLGFVELTPVEKAWKHPTAFNLKQVPKASQTPELLRYVCNEDGLALRYASKRLITSEVCELAVNQNGLALRYVPNKLVQKLGQDWARMICEMAVLNDGLAIQFVPEELVDDDLIIAAVQHGVEKSGTIYDKYPIAFVPHYKLTETILTKAVECTPLCLKDIPQERITKELALTAVSVNGLALQLVPNKLRDKETVKTALENDPLAIRFSPTALLDQDVCLSCLSKEPSSFRYIPVKYLTVELCLEMIKTGCFSIEKQSFGYEAGTRVKDRKSVLFDDIPNKFKNDKSLLNAIIEYNSGDVTPLLRWTSRVNNSGAVPQKNVRGENLVPLKKETEDYLLSLKPASSFTENKERPVKKLCFENDLMEYVNQAALPLPEKRVGEDMVAHAGKAVVINQSQFDVDDSTELVYYISDIHLEHQLVHYAEAILNEPAENREQFVEKILNNKIQEMLSTVTDRSGILLIGGDVADSVDLSALFYRQLVMHWNGRVISVLGNHELWDASLFSMPNEESPHRSIESIVEDYRKGIEQVYWNLSFGVCRSTLLENELFVKYKNDEARVISERGIMEASDEDLEDFLEKCSIIILGGIGYSGLNPKYNATIGLYLNTLSSLEEDIARANRFERIYDKVLRCAADKKVVVLTHTPVYDWTSKPCNNNWIYVNGHTHHNTLTVSEDGATILADNQIGYEPQTWTLRSFPIENVWYDPFESYDDGIYPITSKQYQDFNNGRGIYSRGCNYEGTIYALKREQMYMFVLKSNTSLCILAGGQRKRLGRNDIQYYYDHLAEYCEYVRNLIEPYKSFMLSISNEVKRIGGPGTIHGCIVDISYFSHIYVNPFDGKITPYWAWDISSRVPYSTVQKLLEDKEPHLMKKYLKEVDKKTLLLLSNNMVEDGTQMGLTTVPEWVFGTEMYKPSRIMRAVQYVWEKDVIRIWNDDVLESGELSRGKQLNGPSIKE